MILRELSEAAGVSGNEEVVRSILLDGLRDHVDEIEIDALGNLLTVKRGTGGSPLRIMLAAHMDEIGLMIVDHTDQGMLKVRAVGGMDDRVLPGARLLVGPDRLPGVIGIKPIHLTESDEMSKVTKIKDLTVDIGAKGKGEAEKAAPLGTYATFATRYRELGPTVTGKAFDDRAGCAVLVELLRGDPFASDVHAVFTVQEEVGLRGARVAAYAIEPDCAFVLEGTFADDTPKEKEASPSTELGKGPAITVMDRSFIADRRLVGLLTRTAEEMEIPYQVKQPGLGATDAGAIHLAREGVPSATVSIPVRYIHSPVGMLGLTDFQHTVELMRESLSRLTRDILD